MVERRVISIMSVPKMLEAVTLLIAQIEAGLKPKHPSDHKFSKDLDEEGLCAICGWYSLSDTNLRQAGVAALEELQVMQEILMDGNPEEIEEIKPLLAHLFPEEKQGTSFVDGFKFSIS